MLANFAQDAAEDFSSYMLRSTNLYSGHKSTLCGTSPHDLEHLFNCLQHPTELQEEDLWHHPHEETNVINNNPPTKFCRLWSTFKTRRPATLCHGHAVDLSKANTERTVDQNCVTDDTRRVYNEIFYLLLLTSVSLHTQKLR